MSEDNKAIVRRLYGEVWNGRKFEVIDEIISPTHALNDTNAEGSAMGPEAYRATVNRFIKGFPDIKFRIYDIIAEAEKIVVSWNLTGTHDGPFMGIPATHKRMSVDGITINHIVDGKIMDSYVSWDALGIHQQLGATPPVARTKDASAT